MGIVSTVVKLGIAKKLYDEARKPENQARVKRGVERGAEQVRAYAAQRRQRPR